MPTPYLTFHFQGAWYAVEASQYIIGVVNYRGHFLPVTDLGIRLGQPPPDQDGE